MSHADGFDDASRRLVYFAAERTLTSWMRTALSLMALGFVLDRFDLVLRQLLRTSARHASSSHLLWQWGGAIVIGLGALMALAAGGWYLRFALRHRREAGIASAHSLIAGALFSVVLGIGGVLLIGVLAAMA